MVLLDASALVPLARIGELGLIRDVFDTIETTEPVLDEVLTEGQPGTAAIAAFLENATVHSIPKTAGEVADLEGISTADASVILVAAKQDDPLLANDKALIRIARSHDVDVWWVTTLLLHLAKTQTLPTEEAQRVLYDLVEAGMNLNPQVYAQVHKKIKDIGFETGGPS